MIYGIVPKPGTLASGTGKTLLAVRLVLEQKLKYPDKPIFSNINFLKKEYIPLDVEFFLDKKNGMDTFVRKIMMLDELQQFLDSRRCNSKKQLLILDKIVLQNRHQETDIYWTVHDLDMIDKRLMRATGYIFYCRPMQLKDPTHFEVTVYSSVLGKVTNVFVLDGRPFFNEYNTKELVGYKSDTE